jgi:6-phosphogluconolactonase (cycloisomerase 2 family)
MFTIVPTIDLLTGLTFDQLKANNPAIVSTGSNPVSIAIPSTGGFAFVANNGAASISSFTISPGGVLEPNGPAVTTGAQPSSLAPK